MYFLVNSFSGVGTYPCFTVRDIDCQGRDEIKSHAQVVCHTQSCNGIGSSVLSLQDEVAVPHCSVKISDIGIVE